MPETVTKQGTGAERGCTERTLGVSAEQLANIRERAGALSRTMSARLAGAGCKAVARKRID